MGCYWSKEEIIIHGSSASEDIESIIQKKLQNTKFHDQEDKSERSSLLQKDQVLKEYKFYHTLGKGMFSEVRLAKDQSGKFVAVKIVRKKFFSDIDSIKKIIIEKEVMNTMEHRNILKLLRTFQTNSRLFFVLEFAERGNLLGLINSKQMFTESEFQVIIAQIVNGLFYMHQKGIIYGDLKAENVLFSEDGTLKLCDFNLSGTTKLLDKTIQGTTSYLAPEIIQEFPKTPKSDFWSLGILIHLMFYKKHCFTGPTQGAVLASIVDDDIKPEPAYRTAPAKLRKLILDLLIKNPRNRIGNNIEEFQNHEFFADFEWRNDLKLPESSFPKQKQEDKGVTTDIMNATMNNPVYHIHEFTYNGIEEPSEKAKNISDVNKN